MVSCDSSTLVSAHEVGWQQCVSHQHAAVGGQWHAACCRALASHAQPVALGVLDNVTQRVGGERHQLVAAVGLVLEAMLVIGGQPPHRLAAVGAVAFAQSSGWLAFAAAIEEVFDHFARVIVTLQGGVLPAGRD
eukprot:COSAG04_NODE_820_length_10059_cov_4.579116_4_plen_134_part_00